MRRDDLRMARENGFLAGASRGQLVAGILMLSAVLIKLIRDAGVISLLERIILVAIIVVAIYLIVLAPRETDYDAEGRFSSRDPILGVISIISALFILLTFEIAAAIDVIIIMYGIKFFEGTLGICIVTGANLLALWARMRTAVRVIDLERIFPRTAAWIRNRPFMK